MLIGGHETTERVLLIAEIGNNHEGDLDLALRLIDAAGAAGADVVKFQTIRPEWLVTADQADRRAQLTRFGLPADAWPTLAKAAVSAGVQFMSTPFDLGAVAQLDPLVPAFKIASGDMTFLPLLDAVAATGKPVVMSTGMATLEEVATSINRLRTAWGGDYPGLTVMHCVSCYPTAAVDAALGRIRRIRDLGVEVGYSDHTLGVASALAAVALGARIIEKHFTLDHDQSDFRDHQLSADPGQLATLATAIRSVEAAISSDGDVAVGEQVARGTVRRSIAAARDIPAGSILAADDLTWLRPGTGLPPGQELQLIARRTERNVAAGMMFTPADVGADDWQA